MFDLLQLRYLTRNANIFIPILIVLFFVAYV